MVLCTSGSEECSAESQFALSGSCPHHLSLVPSRVVFGQEEIIWMDPKQVRLPVTISTEGSEDPA